MVREGRETDMTTTMEPTTTEPATERTFELTYFDEIEFKPQPWIWKDWMPAWGVSMIVGIGGRGKSTFIPLLASEMTHQDGNRLSGSFEGQRLGVIIASAEDPSETILGPRLVAAGADLSLVAEIRMRGGKKGDDDLPELLSIPHDVHLIEAAVADMRASRGVDSVVVFIDPFKAHLWLGADAKQEHHMRFVLDQLGAAAQRARAAIVLVDHPNKQRDAIDMAQRVSGAGTYNAIRAAMVFGVYPDDPKSDLRAIASGKSNWGKRPDSLLLRQEGTQIDTGKHIIPTVKLTWAGTDPNLTSDDILEAESPQRTRGKTLTKREHVKILMTGWLARGRSLASETRSFAQAYGDAGDSTVKAATKELPIRKTEDPEGSGIWYWELDEVQDGGGES